MIVCLTVFLRLLNNPSKEYSWNGFENAAKSFKDSYQQQREVAFSFEMVESMDGTEHVEQW